MGHHQRAAAVTGVSSISSVHRGRAPLDLRACCRKDDLHHLVFAITALDTGAPAGFAVICPKARYAAVQWIGETAIDRRRASWRGVEWQLNAGLGPERLARSSAIHQALTAPNASVFCAVKHLSHRSITLERPHRATEHLDAILRDLVASHGGTKT